MNKLRLALILTAVFLFYLLFNFSNTGKIANLRSQDIFRSFHTPHPDIVILAIDNKSLEEIGRWPWERTVHSQIVDRLSEYDPGLIAYDVTFADPSDGDNEFANSLKNADFPIVLVSQAIFQKGKKEPQQILLPLPALLENKNVTHGLANVSLDEDGIIRTFPQEITFNNKAYQPFTYEIARLLNAQIPDAENNKMVHLAGPSGTFPTFSVTDALNNRIPKVDLSGKVILIGATASDLRDTLIIPGRRQLISGVEYHANVLDNILLNRYITKTPSIFPIILGLLYTAIFYFLFNYISAKKTAVLLFILIILQPVLAFIFWAAGFAIFYFSNLLLLSIYFIFNGLYRWYSSEKEKRELRNRFQNYFSPQIMDAIIKDPTHLALGGTNKEITIFFSDIRSFTTITESLPPEKLTEILHEYFTEMTEEILDTDGVVDKFIGDAIMAFWGAPLDQEDQADRAVTAAINMLRRLKKLQKKWNELGYPHVDIGVGINTGTATVGNMGSEKRFDYTIIGDPVNLASRLESLNKEYKSHIIISEFTKEKLKKEYKFKHLGQVTVKGKTKPVTIYSVEV